MNYKLKDFDALLENYRRKKDLKWLWDLDCCNFLSKTLYENICKYCITIKPERAYHCKICKSCIRKLDHHCFIINNCIGFENYKIFLNMLFYAILTLMIVCMAMIESLKIYLNEINVKDI